MTDCEIIGKRDSAGVGIEPAKLQYTKTCARFPPQGILGSVFVVAIGALFTIVDIIVWQNVKSTENPPSPFINVDMQLYCFQKLTGHSFIVTTLI